MEWSFEIALGFQLWHAAFALLGAPLLWFLLRYGVFSKPPNQADLGLENIDLELVGKAHVQNQNLENANDEAITRHRTGKVDRNYTDIFGERFRPEKSNIRKHSK